MDLAELRERIAKWEDLHTEFKEWPAHPDDIAAGVVAFANTDGGQLIFGVANDHSIRGVGDIDSGMRQIDNVAVHNCKPPITVILEVLRPEGEKSVLVLNIPKGDQRPYCTNRGVYFIRSSSGRKHASREELLRLFQASESLYYDETQVGRASVGDLDPDALDHFLRQVFGKGLREQQVTYESLLKNLGLVRNVHPTVAGMLFFGQRPQEFLPYAQINAARIPGHDLSKAPSDRKDFGGRVPSIIEDAARFLQIHLTSRHDIRGFEPEIEEELPIVALREVVVNAVAHRDYTVQAPIRLLIFDDRVEVRTPGRLPNTVSVEAMRLGAAHVVRNPIVYTLCARLGLVTGIGSGVFRLIQAVRETMGKEPDLLALESEFVVVLPRRRG